MSNPAVSTHDRDAAAAAKRIRDELPFLGPSTFEVIERPSNVSHGRYETLDEARGCVAFDRIRDFEIWQGDHIVEERAS